MKSAAWTALHTGVFVETRFETDLGLTMKDMKPGHLRTNRGRQGLQCFLEIFRLSPFSLKATLAPQASVQENVNGLPEVTWTTLRGGAEGEGP